MGAFRLTKDHPYKGRRLRVFSQIWSNYFRASDYNFSEGEEPKTVGDLYNFIHTAWEAAPVKESLSKMYLRNLNNSRGNDIKVGEIPEDRYGGGSNPDLTYALQDLGWIIGYELSEACEVFNNPDIWYPGVDEGIEPVSDDHVDLVIWATQRELDRERRFKSGTTEYRPAAPLDKLPRKIQRAFVERRRMHYKLYGIGPKQYEENSWSLFGIEEDPNWCPPWIK